MVAKKTQSHVPELLAPAGSLDKLLSAVHYGADAVYLGDTRFSLRARSGSFSGQELAQAVGYAHRHQVRVYATVNIFAHNRDLGPLDAYLDELVGVGIDGIIVADPGILRRVRQRAPQLPIHLSTQANVTNVESAAFWQEMGVSRFNLARELDFTEIAAFRAACRAELEVFVHGAVCISYSGRCMLSAYLTGRDANKGDCAHPCRYSYRLVEEKRPGQYYPVVEEERGTYIFNARDLCLLTQLPRLVACGIDAIKIEGRMKSIGYVGGVVRVYRAALDWIQAQAETGAEVERLRLPEIFFQEINRVGTRGQSTHFFTGSPSASDMLYDTMRVDQEFVPAAIVSGIDPLEVSVRTVIQVGDTLEYLGSTIDPVPVRVAAIKDRDGQDLDKAHPGTQVVLDLASTPTALAEHSIFRKRMAQS
jgi:U32 family peptidase